VSTPPSARRTPHAAFRTPHSAFRTPHAAFRTPHAAFRTPHAAFRTPHAAFRTPHAAFRTPHSAFRTPHSAFRTPHSALLLLFLAAAAPGQTFRRNLERVASLDPALAEAVPASRAVALVYETPLEYDYAARPYRLIPGLAAGLPEVSSNGLVYVLRLDPAARFAADPCFGTGPDGRPRDRAVTAPDMVYALKRLADRKVASPGAWLVEDKLLGMRAFAERSAGRAPTDYDAAVEGCTAPDERTLRLELARPFPPFAWLLAMAYASAVPREAVAAYGAGFGEHPVGSGPYRLDAWRRNHEMVFVRRPAWRGWASGPAAVAPGGPPAFERLAFPLMDDATTRWLAFVAGELDFEGNIPRDNWDAVVDAAGALRPELARRGVRLTGMPTMEVHYIGFNMDDPVVGKNQALRQALNGALDGARWEAFMNRRVVRAGGPVPPVVAGHLDAPFPYGFDLARSRRLLAQAGYPEGRDPRTGRRLVLTLDIGHTTQDVRESAELLAAFLDRAGIELRPQYHTWPAFLAKIAERQAQLFRLGWVGDYPDAESFLQLFYSRNVSPGPNRSNYVNPAFDRLYEQALAEPDEAARLGLYRQMQAIVREDCPWLFLHVPRAFSLRHARVANYAPHDFPYGMEKYLRLAAGAH
jgi:ABC-type transport system substrate-binding protein